MLKFIVSSLSSSSSKFFSATAIVNAIFMLATMYRLFGPEIATIYSFLDRDNPLWMPTGPIPTVEMTFHESDRFGLTGADIKDNWETLFTNQFGIGFAHFGPYHFRFIGAAYHSQHCAFSMQEDLDKPNHVEHPSHHYIHCLMYIRQVALCTADHALEDGDFMVRNYTLDRTGPTRKCRDWTAVNDWINQNFKEWSDYNGVSWE